MRTHLVIACTSLAIPVSHSMHAQQSVAGKDRLAAAVPSDTVPLHVVQRSIAAWERKDIAAMYADYDSAYFHMQIGDTAAKRETQKGIIAQLKADTGFVHFMNTARLVKADYDTRGRWVFAVWTIRWADGRERKHYDFYRVEHGKIVYEMEG